MDELQRARLARLRAQIVFARRRGSDAPALLLDAAKRLEALDAGLARETYLEALGAAVFAGRLGGRCGVREVAEAARAAPPGPEPRRPIDLLLDGVATRFTEGYGAGVPALRRALQAFRREALRREDDILRWLWLAWLLAGDLWDDEAWHELATHAVRLAREAGALTLLPLDLEYRAGVHVHAGEFAAASALVEEADAISAATGNAPLRYASLFLAAWRGDEAQALKLIEARARDATARGEGRAIGLVECVTAVLYNGLGRYEAALVGAQRACEHEDLVFFGWSLVELVEAGARSGAHDAAAGALRQLEERTRAAGTDWALGILARSSALLSSGQAAEPCTARPSSGSSAAGSSCISPARTWCTASGCVARTGAWTRGSNCASPTRCSSRIGAEAFAERARGELLATGETVRKRTVESRDVLTAQEAQVARLAAQGRTNPEIGTQLFISPRTAEYHLHKVFTKLGISSRRRLRDALRDSTQVSLAGVTSSKESRMSPGERDRGVRRMRPGNREAMVHVPTRRSC